MVANISFQDNSRGVQPVSPGSIELIPANPRGLVIYPDNNSRQRGFAFYRAGQQGQSGRKTRNRGVVSTSRNGRLRTYEITLHNRTTINVLAPTSLSKSATRITAYDPTSEAEVGYLNYELLLNASGGIQTKPDSSGEFRLIARKFRSLYGLSDPLICPFENVHDDLDPEGTRADTRNNFFDALEAVTQTQLDFFAYAGHGGRSSLPSAQVRQRDLDRLQTQIQRIVRPGGIVLLYACQTGYAGGFASQLSRRLPTMAIWGHTDSGQASRNADKIVYRNGQGVDIRNVLTSEARTRFAGHLLSSADFYARFAFMTQAAIEYELLSS